MKASEVIKLAEEEVGYIGKLKPTDNLYIKEAPSGAGLYTKYAKELFEAGYYNGNKNGFSWCCVFMDWLYYHLAGDKAKAEEVKPTGIYGAGVRWAKGYFPESRISNLPSVGAQVFYKDPKNGELTHTGLVVKVTENSITTIEGNWSKQVSVRTLPLTDTRIDSFGLPFYEEEPTDEWETVAEWDNYRLQHRK